MASYQIPRFTRALTAAVDLSTSQYLYVKDNGSDEAVLSGGATGEFGAGLLQNKPLLGEVTEIMGIGGGAKGVASATVSGPQIELIAVATGKLAPATAVGDIVIALSKSGAAVDDVFEVELVYYRKHV